MRRDPAALGDGIFDLLVIGGGCSGAGVALDAASRGLRTALVDMGDFASATSSASSKLVHGGLRYLENGQLRLVHEALAERRLLLRNAPHLVRPLRFLLPFYRTSRLPRWKGRLGLWLYDILAGKQNLRPSRDLPVQTLRRGFPNLRSDGLIGAAEYYDAQMDDARLALAIVQTAVNHGAVACNYVKAIGISGDTVELEDTQTGQHITARARQLLNAAGPWVDAVRRLAGEPAISAALQPTKGVHLILKGTPYAEGGPSLSGKTAFTLLHPRDGRVFFILPWEEHTLLGTTDTFSDETADALTVNDGDVEYLLEGYNHYFAPNIAAPDVLGRFAGLRPLLKTSPEQPSARSREYRLIEGPGGLLSVAGGKWTTYRHMAEVITDVIAARLRHPWRCRTAQLPLWGAPTVPWNVFRATESEQLTREFGWKPTHSMHLINRYGNAARRVAEVVRDRNGCRPILDGEPDLLGELEYQREHEMAVTPADHLLRRSRIGLWNPEAFLAIPAKDLA